MQEFMFSGISFQHYAIFDRKNDFKKNKFENRFSNRKPVFGFRLTSLI